MRTPNEQRQSPSFLKREKMVEVEINVTRKHIDEGEAWDCKHCPVALAMTECINEYAQTAKFRTIEVSSKTFWCAFDNKTYPLPENVTKWIRKFDRFIMGSPFDFKVKIPA